MNNFKDTVVLATLAMVLSAASVLAWISGLWMQIDSSLVRGGLVLTWLTVSGVAVTVALRRTTHDLQVAYKSLDRMSRLCLDDVSCEAELISRVPVSAGSPWYGVLERLRSTLLSARERFEAAESQRQSAEVRARRQQVECERIHGILAGLTEPVLVVDAFDRLVLANPSAERLFQFHLEGTEKRALDGLIKCQQLIDVLHESRRRKAGALRTDEVQLPSQDGQPRWYSITANPISADHGSAAIANSGGSAPGGDGDQAAVAVLRDITHQKAIQKRNAEFVSAVSHEMKTPLAGIKAYVEMLVDGDAEDDETQEEFLNVINTQADRLRRLIDNLLNLARIESGVVKVHKAPCSLNEILEEAFHVVRPSAEQKQLALSAELSPMYLNVLVDRDQILQAAINLLSNAIKYTREGGSVVIRSRLTDDQAQFEVEDSGVGLSPEDCVKVFEKFYRVQKDKQMAAGTGLGLPLAKYIVEDVHGGSLTVQSELNVGSKFIITLPTAGK